MSKLKCILIFLWVELLFPLRVLFEGWKFTVYQTRANWSQLKWEMDNEEGQTNKGE